VAQTKRVLPEASLTRPAWINWASKQSCAADICYTVHKALRCLNKAAMRALPKINTHWHPETLIKMNLGELKVSNVALLWNSSGIAVDCMSATKAVLQDSLTCIPRSNFVTNSSCPSGGSKKMSTPSSVSGHEPNWQRNSMRNSMRNVGRKKLQCPVEDVQDVCLGLSALNSYYPK
jgi:hypothetical protein